MITYARGAEQRRRQRSRAARVVAGYARDARDLAELLDMLGLITAEDPRSPAAGRRQVPGPRHSSEAERDLATALLSALTRELR